MAIFEPEMIKSLTDGFDQIGPGEMPDMFPIDIVRQVH